MPGGELHSSCWLNSRSCLLLQNFKQSRMILLNRDSSVHMSVLWQSPPGSVIAVCCCKSSITPPRAATPLLLRWGGTAGALPGPHPRPQQFLVEPKWASGSIARSAVSYLAHAHVHMCAFRVGAPARMCHAGICRPAGKSATRAGVCSASASCSCNCRSTDCIVTIAPYS